MAEIVINIKKAREAEKENYAKARDVGSAAVESVENLLKGVSDEVLVVLFAGEDDNVRWLEEYALKEMQARKPGLWAACKASPCGMWGREKINLFRWSYLTSSENLPATNDVEECHVTLAASRAV